MRGERLLEAAQRPVHHSHPARRGDDAWAAEALERQDLDALLDYRQRAPALGEAHPTVDHFVPLFVTLGASLDADLAAHTRIQGYWLSNSKRSVEFR